MSFILDALKKSDRKRQSETVPKLQTEHQKPVVPGSRRWLWLPILALFLVVNIAVLLWVFGPWQEPPAAEVRSASAVDSPPVPPGSHPVEPVAAKPAPKTSPEPKQRTAQQQQVLPIGAAAKELPAAVGKGRIYAIEELPNSIRERMPALHMSLHAYSREQAAASLVRVNNQILREGAELPGGFLLAEITANGAVFSHQGYRFLLPRKNFPDN